ncbi:MAG: DUF4965 domain-containing protein [Bacteroidetes bacterium]|uniref:DUF4965 domain-containing protein n=1 Tax=Candidatus Cryptobacteroides avicola TaxID=2840757 RepID=A0A940IIF8_9BACT|nr:DUF4965 domain-containing protein [Candidatus Cryptobacteroides avicola]
MKNRFLLGLVPLAGVLASCSNSPAHTEVIKNDLRAPAWPLVTIDPYTSAWSMSDKLYDGSVKHWTGKDFPLIGAVRVDGTVYRFMGTEDIELFPVVPTSQQGQWYGNYTERKPSGNWTAPDFNDSSWKKAEGAFGTTESEPIAKTDWSSPNIWVRRTFELDEDLTRHKVYLEFCNDDDAIFYINGIEVHNTGAVCHKNEVVRVPDEAVATLKKGKNIIAAECKNPVANGLLDFGLLIQKEMHTALELTAQQTSADVQATQTHYTFKCGPVDLALTFTAPQFLEDLELLSRPVNYISYDIRSNDGQKHDVSIYMEASPRWALDQPYQESISETFTDGNLVFVKSGSKEQDILAKKGDDLRIDWGYFYLAADKGNTSASIGNSGQLREAYVKGETLPASVSGENGNGKMALVSDLGNTAGASGKFLIGYDDIYSIQYFGRNLRPYWNADGNTSIMDMFHKADAEYKTLMKKCYAFDNSLMKEAIAAGGKEYADLCALAYRHINAAHKLVKSPEGELMWLSKENNSNGCIGTVDLTYPSSPIYLYYNPELAKAMMNHIFYYSESGKWTKPFAAHDIGTYPLANGQVYGGDMPVEESGNMIILTAAVSVVENDTAYAARHWETLTTWTDYLVEFGLDPANQLCTDDFAGHFAHNVNLSAKAIVAIASYGKMAEMLGKTDVAQKYTAIAKDYAQKWMKMADDGDHYRLTFDKPGTWSQKYNIVWDKLLGLGLFPKEVYEKEIAWYLDHQNVYGLPLDNRETYTKTDWIMWTATLADDQETFRKFISPLHKFYNETVDRVPMSDWIWTDKPNFRGFKARSVVGGYYIKMLENKLAE